MFSLQIVETRSIHHSQQQQYFISHRSYLLYSHRFRLFSGHHPLARAGRKKKVNTGSLYFSVRRLLCAICDFFFFLDATRTETEWAFDNNLTRMHAREAAMNRKIKFFFKESHAHWRHSLVGYKTRTEQWYLCASSMYFLPQNDVPCSL